MKLTEQEQIDDTLRRIRTAGSVSISPELFEKLYLSPQNAVKGELRKTFANPTPVAIGGFLLALTPLSCILLGWRGSGLLGASDVGAYYFFGGLLMILGSVGEFFLGNTFPTIVFSTFGAFWLVYGSTLTPGYGAYTTYATNASEPLSGLSSPTFAASFAFFLCFMGLLCFIFLIASVRTNVVFFLIFLLLVPAFSCLAGAFWHNAEGQTATGLKLQHAGAGLTFAVCMLGWYLFTVLVLAAVDFPLNLPVGDLSGVVKGASDRAAAKEARGGAA